MSACQSIKKIDAHSTVGHCMCVTPLPVRALRHPKLNYQRWEEERQWWRTEISGAVFKKLWFFWICVCVIEDKGTAGTKVSASQHSGAAAHRRRCLPMVSLKKKTPVFFFLLLLLLIFFCPSIIVLLHPFIYANAKHIVKGLRFPEPSAPTPHSWSTSRALSVPVF